MSGNSLLYLVCSIEQAVINLGFLHFPQIQAGPLRVRNCGSAISADLITDDDNDEERSRA